MPVASIEEYYERIENTSRDMAADIEDAPPEECRKKAFNLFACSSYAFCSEDRKALLVKTSREDCEDIGRWYVRSIDYSHRFYVHHCSISTKEFKSSRIVHAFEFDLT